MGVYGTSLAISLSTTINFFVLCAYITSIKDPKLREAWQLPNKDAFKGLISYLRLGVFATALIWLEWCAFEFQTLMSGYLSDVDATATQILLFNF